MKHITTYLLLFLATFSITSCIEPPLHLPGQEMKIILPQVDTDIDVAWDVHRGGDEPPERGDEHVRAHEDERGREPHADRVLKRSGHRQRRAEPQRQPERRIVLEQAVPKR